MVTLDQYKSVCPETSAVFVASDFKENEGLYTRILEFQTASGINLLMKGRKFKKGIKYYPVEHPLQEVVLLKDDLLYRQIGFYCTNTTSAT